MGVLTVIYGDRSTNRRLDIHLEADDLAVCHTLTNSSESRRAPMSLYDRMETGSWFGESCLFDEHRILCATLTSREETDLAVLTRTDFFRIIQKYPRLLDRHMKLQGAIGRGRLSFDELAFRRARI